MHKRKKYRQENRLSSDYGDDDFDDTPLATRVSSIKILSASKMDLRDKSFIEPNDVEEEEEHDLNFIQASLFATVLEDAATQLRILAECNNELRIHKTISDMDGLILKKYNVSHKQETDELAGIDLKKIHGDKYKLDKLAYDRKFCNDLILATYLDLSLHKNFGPMRDMNAERRAKEQYCATLVEDEAKNKIIRREVLKQLRQQRNHQKTAMYETDVAIETIRSHLEDALLIANIRERYMDNWQIARTEQNIQSIIDKEAGPSNNIMYFRKRVENETRVHSEVELLTSIHITETLQKVEAWMDKYDADIEKLDLQIQLKKSDYKAQVDLREEMEKRLARHKELMDNWVKFKEEREAHRQYCMKMTNAATVVQAWWRGLLVRLKLGPYKEKKKGGRGKKKN